MTSDNESIVLRSKADVLQIVNSRRSMSRHSRLIVAIALGGVFIDAYDFTSLGIGVVQLQAQFHLTAAQLGSVTASMAIGAFIAAFIGGYYIDKIGRLKTFLLDLFFFFISAILSAIAPNLIWLLTFRFLMGVGVGLDIPVALSFIAEFTALNRRGRMVNIWGPTWYVAATLGFLIIIPLHFVVGNTNLWRWAVGLGAIPALIVLIFRYIYMIESPLWAANTGNLQEAARILRQTYGIDAQIDLEYQALRYRTTLKDIARVFAPRYRLRTLLAVVISMTQSMEYFAVGFYLPSITLLIFGKNFVLALVGSAIVNFFGIVAGLLNLTFIQHLGLRRMVLIGYAGIIASLLIIGIFGNELPIYIAAACIVLFIGFNSFGPGGIGMTLSTLSYPTAIRGIGTGITQSLLRVGSTLGFYFFPLVLAAVGLYHTLLLLVFVPLIGLSVTLAIRWDPIRQNIDVDQDETEKTQSTENASTGD